MRFHIQYWIVSFLVFSSLACSSDVTLVISNRTEESIRNCGCGPDPEGGIARRAGAVARMREKPGELYLLDIGGVVKPVGSSKAFECLVEAMNVMKYDVGGVGPQEASSGSDLIAYYGALADFPILSAKLKDHDLDIPEIVKLRKDLYVTSVFEEESGDTYALRGENPVRAAISAREQIPREALLIVLAAVSRATANEIAIALGSTPSLVMGYAELGSDALPLIEPGKSIRAGIGGKGGDKFAEIRFAREFGEWRLKEYQVHRVNSSLPDDPAVAAIVANCPDASQNP